MPWVTGIRIFRPEIGSPIGNLTEPLYPDGHIPGRFDDDITFRCRRCQQWSPLTASIQSAIASIHKAARLSKEDSPVLHLPTGAWDRESQLKFECPQCHQPHKSTPFVVDRRSER
ncbi:MAG: hypothetical protein ACKVHE_35820 [Planctomycetales bacterium]